MQESADKKLAARLMQGDSHSFDVFFNSYFPRIFRFALARLNQDHDLAEDTAQVVLCQAISRMSTYRGEAPLFSWLCTFCRHEIAKQRKARGLAQGSVPFTEDDPAVRSALESLLSTTSSDPDVAAYKAELSQLVKVALDHLPALYADSLECKYVHGYSVRHIADLIGKSEKATESILTRARIAFRDCFESLINEEQQHLKNGNLLSSVYE
jgi:RNA polymerase sigma-70 factor (ECF subfamily)